MDVYTNSQEEATQAIGEALRLIQDAIVRAKPYIYVTPENIPDHEALGVLVARKLDWDGIYILEAAWAALEEANFHDVAQKVAELYMEITGVYPWRDR